MADTVNPLTIDNIKEYKEVIENNRDNFQVLINNYKFNVSDINTDITLIKFDDWSDSVSETFSAYIESLKNGIVSKLDASISADGSSLKLVELINDLYDKCSMYITTYDSFIAQDSNLIGVNSGFQYSSNVVNPVFNDEQLAEINKGLSLQRDVISDILLEIKTLKFDDSVVLGVTDMPPVIVTPSEIEEPDLIPIPEQPPIDEEDDELNDNESIISTITSYNAATEYIRGLEIEKCETVVVPQADLSENQNRVVYTRITFVDGSFVDYKYTSLVNEANSFGEWTINIKNGPIYKRDRAVVNLYDANQPRPDDFSFYYKISYKKINGTNKVVMTPINSSGEVIGDDKIEDLEPNFESLIQLYGLTQVPFDITLDKIGLNE